MLKISQFLCNLALCLVINIVSIQTLGVGIFQTCSHSCLDPAFDAGNQFNRLRLRGGADESKHTSDQDQAILNELETMRNECKAVLEKISELEQERDDHEMVSTVLSDFPPSRRCYRSVGGVLMERTVSDIVPEIRSEWVKLSKALSELNTISEKKRQAIEAFKVEHSIRIVRDPVLPND